MSKEQPDFSKIAANIIKTPLETFVEDNYLPYAHYVISNRALISDDGLKPVQRRIFYAMHQLGLSDTSDFTKAAQIVGETMGKYHPHGDASIGDALARLGQDFSMRVPLVDVQGSVGHTTGDVPSAPRYWEGRPTKAAVEFTKELREGAVEMGLNYDGKLPEPALLPIRWPNGIINGSQGIAVGYSSNVISHNPTEVMNALIELAKNPELTLNELMKIMPGPDMPTGGVVYGIDGIKDYYRTGKGRFSLRGEYEIVPGARGTHKIFFYEAPYQVSALQIITAIDKAKKRDRLKEVSEIKDLSEDNFKLSIGVKAGANPEVVLRDLFKWTPLEQKISASMNVLKDGAPKELPMLELLNGFLEFRKECIFNKANNKIVAIDSKINRLSGIVAVMIDIDKTIDIIRKAENAEIAQNKLQKTFKLNEEQAEFILSMPLRRLTKSDKISIDKEIKESKEESAFLKSVLSDNDVFVEYLMNELEATKKIIQDDRRTVISKKSEDDLKEEDKEVVKEAAKETDTNALAYITLFTDDTILRTKEPFKQARTPNAIASVLEIGLQDNIIFVKKNGEGIKLPAVYVPEDNIIDVSTVTGHAAGEVIGMGPEKYDDYKGIFVMTSSGGINIVNGGIPTADTFQLVKLEDEVIIHAQPVTEEMCKVKSVVLVTSDGYISQFPLEQVRTSNSGAGTVRGMSITEGEQLVGGSIASPEDGEVASVTHKAMKVTSLSEIPMRNRNAKGVILQRMDEEDETLNAIAGKNIIASKNGRNIKLPKASERATKGTNRNGSGVVLGFTEIQ